jgi:PKD repeat protein
MRHDRATFALVLWLSLWLFSATTWALNPNLPPGSNFNLNNWYIQFPTENGSLTCTAGSVDSASTTQLINGYTNAPYFYTGSDGAMVFWAPINGATTSGTTFPRSELRELINPSNTSIDWIPYGTHILNAQVKVLQVPSSTKEVIIGQIHAYSSAALPTVKIIYDNGKLHGTVKTNSTDDGSDLDFPTVTSGLSNTITYTIEVVNGLVSVAINGITNSYNIFHSDPNYTNETQYFKAGDYCQANSCSNPSTNDGARIAFYALTRFQAPSITNQPGSQSVSVGSNVTFTVGALGNPPLKYAWQLNSTPINNATNASLIIPNAQLTNAGTYSVIVTDLVGSVTSTNAILTVVAPAPVASFTASPTNGAAPLTVSFTDNSSGSITGWAWVFGDGNTSISQSPSNIYVNPGVYNVQEIVSGPGGSGTGTVANLISVYDPFAWWQLQYFGGTNNNPNTAPGGDFTGTGMSNTNKFLAGLNPTNPAAYLQIINVAITNTTDINVIYLGANGDSTWSPGIASRTNVLEFTAGAASGDYSNNFISANVTDILSGGTGSGSVTNMVDAGGATNIPSRYYRVRVLVP